MKLIKSFGRSKTKSGKKSSEKVSVQSQYLARISEIRASLPSTSLCDSSERTFAIIHAFFQDLIGTKACMTVEEIVCALERKRLKRDLKSLMQDFLKPLTTLEYGGLKLTRKRLEKILQDFEDIVKQVDR